LVQLAAQAETVFLAVVGVEMTQQLEIILAAMVVQA
jgi:hypothetical protein